MVVDNELINSIREKFVKEYQLNPSIYYESDYEKIKAETWPIERYVLVHKTENASIEALIKTMKWRKEFGILDRTDADFPQEVYQLLGLFMYGKDKEGRDLLMTVGKYHHKTDLSPVLKQYWVHVLEKIDSRNKNSGWATVAWTNGTGLSNLEVSLSLFLVDIIQNHFPSGFAYQLIIDMHWILNATWKIIRNFMREEVSEKVRLVDSKVVREYVNDDQIPEAFGGTSKEPMLKIPPKVKPLDQIKDKFGFNDKQVEKIRSSLKDALKDNPVCQ